MDTEPIEIHLEATVDAHLRTVRGTMRVDGAEGPLVDPLAALPDPPDDLQSVRTFPGRRSRGSVAFTVAADGAIAFTATLPRRYGAIGRTRHGLFADGGWYPQLPGLPVAAWDVQVDLPARVGGALADQVGTDVLTWTGAGERAPLAVVRRPVFTELAAAPSEVTLLTKGKPRRTLVRELGTQLAQVPRALAGVVVEAPLRRRLTYGGPGLAYVSDRAFRLAVGLSFAHRRAVVRGVASALVPIGDPFVRGLAGAALGRVQEERLRGSGSSRLLGAFSWVPQVNTLLASERIPFYAEVLDRKWPGDPVRDDLAEIFAPTAPGEAVLAQLDDFYGLGTGTAVGQALAGGAPLADALAAAGVAPEFLDPWRAPFPAQDYRLDVVSGEVWVTRSAPPTAPPEIIDVVVDGRTYPITVAPGGQVQLDGPPPRSVALDPEQHVFQTSRHRDTWPALYDPTFALAFDSVNLSQGQIFLTGTATLRRQYDTHNLWVGTLSHTAADLVNARIGWLRKEGRLLDGWTRAHRIRADVGFAVFDPKFADTAGHPVAVDAVVSYTHDTRVSSNFPLRGHKLTLAAGAGGIPGTPLTWTSATAQAVLIGGFHPRWAFASRTTISAAQSPLDHRLLLLGGSAAMQSIPALPVCSADGPEVCFPVGTSRLVSALELRAAPLRDLNVPLLLGWLSEVQLDVGGEALGAFVDAGPSAALAVTAGATAIVDTLGADPGEIGVTLGWPVWWYELPLEHSAMPTFYLRFAQAF